MLTAAGKVMRVPVCIKSLRPLAVLVALATMPTVAGQENAPAGNAAGVSVSGRVENLARADRPAAQPTGVVLFPDTGGPGMIGTPQRAVVTPDGTFELTSVTPGLYRIAPDPNPLFQDRLLEVGTAGVKDFVLPYLAPTEITVHVRVDDGSPVPEPAGEPFAWAFAIADDVIGGFVRGAQARFTAVPAEAYFFLRPPAGYFVVSLATADGRNLVSGRFTVPRGAARPIDVHAVVSRTAPAGTQKATVTGKLTGNHPDLEVVLIDLTRPAATRQGARTMAKVDGSFVFSDVAPGVYDIDVPPATSVKRRVMVAGSEVNNLLVELPEGQLFSGAALGFVEENGTRQPRLPGRFTLRFKGASLERTLKVRTQRFWDALPPGEYEVSVEDLEPGVSVEFLQAGSFNLSQGPFRVPADRNP